MVADTRVASKRIGIRILFRVPVRAAVVIVMSGLVQTVSVTPLAVADPIDEVRAGVTQMRGGSSCGGFRSDPLVERTAYLVNQSVDRWIDHTIRFPPIDNPLPLLKDLGYRGSKAAMGLGASKNLGDAIKGMLLEGWAAIPDCSYTDYGVSILLNKTKNYFLTAVVVAGA